MRYANTAIGLALLAVVVCVATIVAGFQWWLFALNWVLIAASVYCSWKVFSDHGGNEL